MKLTRGAIRDRVRILVSDTGPTGGNWVEGYTSMFPFDTYNRFVSDALRAIYSLVPWPEVEETQSAVSGTATYVTQQTAQIELVDFNNRALEGATAMRLERLDEKWRTRTGKPRFYVLGDSSDWAVVSGIQTREFRLYPTPTSTDTIRVIGRWFPTELYNDWSVPALPGWLQEVIAYEAAAMVLEAPTEHRNPELAAAYREIVKWYTETGLFHLGNRYPKRVTVRGEFTWALRGSGLVRNPHVPFTGIAPGTAE